MHSVSSTIANGFVHVPEQADWLPQYLHEMGVFPNGKYDDQVDSISQALDWAKNGMCHGGLFEYYRQEAEKLGYRSAPEKERYNCRDGQGHLVPDDAASSVLCEGGGQKQGNKIPDTTSVVASLQYVIPKIRCQSRQRTPYLSAGHCKVALSKENSGLPIFRSSQTPGCLRRYLRGCAKSDASRSASLLSTASYTI